MATAPVSSTQQPAPSEPGDGSMRSLPGLMAILKETVANWLQDNAMRLSAALSLYTILSLAPLLVITIKLVGFFWKGKAEQQVHTQLSALMGPQAAEQIQKAIQPAMQHGSGILATVVSTAVLLFSACGVFIELQDSMNTVWGVKPKPNQGIWGFVRNRLLSLAMVLGVGFLLLVSMFVSTVLGVLARGIAGDVRWLAIAIEVIVSLGVVTLLFAAIFKFLPDVKLAWRNVWFGAVVTAMLFTIGKYALSVYFTMAAPTSAFGAAGAPVAVLLWVYYSSFLLFFGAEFTKVYTLHHDKRVVPDDHAVRVTETDRAKQGIPSPKRMSDALAGRPLASAAKPSTRATAGRPSVPSRSPANGSATAGRGGHGSFGPVDYALAAGGLVLGAVAGGLGVHYLADDPRRPARKHLAAVRLDERLGAIETKVGRVARMKDILEDVSLHERIHRVEKEIRRAGTHVRAQETGRPRWAVRLADWIGGRWSNL